MLVQESSRFALYLSFFCVRDEAAFEGGNPIPKKEVRRLEVAHATTATTIAISCWGTLLLIASRACSSFACFYQFVHDEDAFAGGNSLPKKEVRRLEMVHATNATMVAISCSRTF
jgi:hypothetical protein